MYAEVVGGLEGSGEDVFGGGGEPDVGHARAAPATGDGEENFGEFVDEGLLLVESEFEIAVALSGVGERGEDVAVYAEVGITHVRGFFGIGEAEGDAAEVADVHGEYGNAGAGNFGGGGVGVEARRWGLDRCKFTNEVQQLIRVRRGNGRVIWFGGSRGRSRRRG